MKTKNTSPALLLGLGALVLTGVPFVRAQDAATDTTDTTTTTEAPDTTKAATGDTGDTGLRATSSAPDPEPDPIDEARYKNAAMLIQTLSEEKTEINTLAAQQARFKQMGGRDNTRLGAMWGRWIREHKAAGPTLMKLIKQNGGDPMQARILKAPVLGTTRLMVDATHKDHQAAVMTSQMRYTGTSSRAIKTAMHKRGNLARKHIRQMSPYHKAMQDMRTMDKMSVQG